MNELIRDGAAWSRRGFLSAGFGLAAAGLFPFRGAAAADGTRRRVLRIAHLTDMHIQPELRAAEGVSACLRQLNDMPDRPDLILSGGDHIMDSFRRPRERTATQWNLWSQVVKNENGIPIHSCLGNHDVWGWDRTKSGTTGTEPEYGKRWACDVLGLDKPYYSFTQGGWRLIALDGVQPSPRPGEFSAFLDDEQYDWLQRELESLPSTTPVLLWTHIPIVSAVVNHLATRATIHDDGLVEAGHVHADSLKIVNLLSRFPNVKACLGGHLHRVERVDLRGIQHYCNGAVCGKWWRGANEGFPEGFALVDLYEDGSHECRYQTYGWQAKEREKPS
ncbi:metallophosphoesterase family protein [Planctomicrobium piriforme]|uniref:3',5'-cyclic AMP phosphodiesterase CpdA n=1 Tax=Planctomicrobium piriforme TaxID=1576369 RepID=A0A1I3H2M3_9PLAN|nr:metallophosphoesterase [Planctomicrobium piriforme]SFI29812.1 3',5'-cyclic AMP phosphodiesterase CpdA [Planctomicrobium piriforme]